MYAELFRKRNYWPGICVGIAMATVAALLDPLSKTYVAYQTLARSGVSYNNAVLMSSLSLHGAYAVGKCPRNLLGQLHLLLPHISIIYGPRLPTLGNLYPLLRRQLIFNPRGQLQLHLTYMVLGLMWEEYL